MKVLITGGTGFLGGALTQRFIDLGVDVAVIGRDQQKGALIEKRGARFISADLADALATKQACHGRDVVFHVGALSAPWGRFRDFYASNVVGTRNVILGCQKHDVSRLVHVSSASVYNTGNDQFKVKESDPLPQRYNSHYIKTKRLAEYEVCEAVKKEGLPAIIIRPRAIFGPEDSAILPRLIRALERRRLPILGDGKVITDITYVDNVVDALLLCARAPDQHFGKVYNITNGEPVELWGLIKYIADKLDLPPPNGRVPVSAALVAAGILENAHKIFLPKREPLLTRHAVTVLARSMTLDITAAKQDLNYLPEVSVDEGLGRFIAWWKGLRR